MGVGITVHRATRLDHLAAALGELLAAAPPGPFEAETIIVPTRGVERWLAQMLSHRLGTSAGGSDGVAAGITFHAPRSFTELFAAAADDPWDPPLLSWRILDLAEENAHQEWLRPLTSHLGIGPGGQMDPDKAGRRYPVARRIADLFASYSQRPELLQAWLAGEPTDGVGELGEDLLWQMHLLSQLAARIGHPPPGLRTADVLTRAQQAGLTRVQVFGHTRLSAPDVEVLRALSEHAEVHLWLPHPSPALWEEEYQRASAAGEPARTRAEAGTAPPGGNALLRTLGGEARELVHLLAPLGPSQAVSGEVAAVGGEAAAGGEEGAAPMLARIQHGVRTNTAPAQGPRDDSITIHACHGPSRQVEVLRDQLTALFEDNRDLQPRDVIVLCPDVNTYAPLFHAAFGPQQGAAHPGHSFRIGLADRNLAATNPLLDLARQLVGFVGGRVRASELIDLLHRVEVRGRFAWSDTDLETITEWVAGSGMRWGLDARTREPFHVGITQNTIEAGLDRLLLGVTMSETGHALSNVLPYDPIGSTEISLVGSLAELLQRLRSGLDRLETSATVAQWAQNLRDLIDEIAEPEHAWQASAFARALSHLGRGGQAQASRADFRRLLDDAAQPRSSSANLRTGALTIASLVPMRSVPHRVVCLVGMDDGAFPRGSGLDGDDALARTPLIGERDRRIEDRQLFLDAVMSATERLIITYTGAGQRRGEDRHPAVPVAELIDAMTSAGGCDRGDLVVHHPLHPFDSRYFSGEPGLVSFDGAAAAAARSRTEPAPRPAFLPAPLAPLKQVDVELLELQTFLADPVKTFVRERLGVSLGGEFAPIDDAIPTSAAGLEEWKIGERLLHRILQEGFDRRFLLAERLRGELPPGTIGGRELKRIADRTTAVANLANHFRRGQVQALDVDLPLDPGRLSGRVLHVYGNRLVRVSYSKLGPKHRLATWVDLLALTLARPEDDWEAVTIGRHPRRDGEAQACTLAPIAASEAQHHLSALLDIRSRGMCEPLPIPPKTAAEWARRVAEMGGRETPARRAEVKRMAGYKWSTGYRYPGEDQDPYQVLAWGEVLSFEDLLSMAPQAGEQWNSETTRLGQYAVRMWEGVLGHERF